MFRSILLVSVLALLVYCEDDVYPCDGNSKVVVSFIPGLLPGEENQYVLTVALNVPAQTKIQMRFDSEANLELSSRTSARISTSSDTAEINVFKRSPLGIGVRVQGDVYGSLPYLQSLKINSIEYCEYPKTGYLDFLTGGNQHSASVGPSRPESSRPTGPTSSGCGRRKVDHTELVVNGQPSKHGDWPWHVALFEFNGRVLEYRCGGTLLSKVVVLTAAHCVTPREATVNPDTLSVVLGKYNLIGSDISTQEREVLKVVVHEDFEKKLLHNDIALLKLKSEALYTDYVQPACLWSAATLDKLPPGIIFGTVVGWGLDNTDRLSPQLQQAVIPMVPESTCVKTKPDFYYRIMTDQKFCAGYANGTSACNGDSGGSFTVFIPDSPGSKTGSYHVRGIVSTTVSRQDAPICDPNYYVVFTDVSKFTDWIARNMN